jgi:hypothetical protein
MTMFKTASMKISILCFRKGGGAYGESGTQGASNITRERAIDESDRESYAT